MDYYLWAWEQIIFAEELLLCLWVGAMLSMLAWNYRYLGGTNAR